MPRGIFGVFVYDCTETGNCVLCHARSYGENAEPLFDLTYEDGGNSPVMARLCEKDLRETVKAIAAKFEEMGMRPVEV